MAKVLINSLIDEINLLLSRPVGSLSRKASPDVIHHREQLKQLRSHLENLADDIYIGSLKKQYSDLVYRLSNYGDIKQNIAADANSTFNVETKVTVMDNQPAKIDQLETLPPTQASPMDNIFAADADLVMETSTMTNATPEATFINDRVIASLQQVIQQSLQQVVKDSVQQVVSQTLAVERALMVGEISANLSQSLNQSLTKIVEAEQRSQINQELINLNQQKQKLSAEIAQLEADRSRWMQQFQEFQNAQQESLDRSLQTVNSYLREQITDTVQQTVQQKIQETVRAEASQEEALANKVQEQTNQFLAQLDEMFNSTFRSLEQDMQEYQGVIAAKIGYMESLELRGEELISALVDQIQHNQIQVGNTVHQDVGLPDLPDDIPPQYLETVPEPADENLISALLAGNEFGEAIAISDMETVMEVSPEYRATPDPSGDETTPSQNESLDLEIAPNPLAENLIEPTLISAINDDVTQLESILGAPSETLFEEAEVSLRNTFDDDNADDNAADFDISAATQLFIPDEELVESEPTEAESAQQQNDHQNALQDASVIDSQTTSIAEEASQDSSEDPELLNWLEETSNRNQPINIGEIAADAELMSWLGNEALDMAKLPEQELSNLPSAIAHQDLERQILPIPNNQTSANPKAEPMDLPLKQDVSSPKAIPINEPFLYEFRSDRADDADESLILLANETHEDTQTNWADNLFEELNSDLSTLEQRQDADLEIAANLDQFIRNTPYSQTKWDDLDLNYPTIVEVSAYANDASEVPPIIENPEALFEDSEAEQELTQTTSDHIKALELPDSATSPADDVDSIFAEVIAENVAKYAQPLPFNEDDSTLDTLLFGFDPSAEILGEQPQINPSVDAFMPKLSTQSETPHDLVNTLMQSMPDEQYEDLNFDTDTIKNRALQDADLGLETLDTILQTDNSFDALDQINQIEINDLDQDADQDITSYLQMEDLETVLDTSTFVPIQPLADDRPASADPIDPVDDWTAALEQLEAKLTQPSTEVTPIATTQKDLLDLSADEFFASLEYEKLNDFADRSTSNTANSRQEANPIDELDADDLLLNQFADFQDRVEPEPILQDHSRHDGEWDLLINELESINFQEPLIDQQRQKLGLSAVAPIADSLANVLDIDSLVLDTRRDALVPPTPTPERYSLDDVWVLGIDFGNMSVRTSLLNASTGIVYPLLFDEAEELSCQVVWRSDLSIDDPIGAEMRVIHKKNKNLELENGEVLISHFKQLLKVGLPYRGVSAWQPIIQWTEPHQLSLRWLIAALKNVLEQIQTRATHPRLPDLGLILLKLNSVVFCSPAHWSDTYVLNVREAILKAGLVKQEEQVLAVEQAIAPVLDLLHHHAFANQMTLLVESGALTTSFCLVKGSVDDVSKLDRSKLQVLSLDYAGHTLSQDIVIQLFAPHWQLITNPHRQLFHLDHLQLPEVSDPAPHLRSVLQQYLLSSEVGRQMLDLADRVKNAFGADLSRDTWNEEIMGQPLLVMRRELENLIFQPFIKRLNRELNSLLSNMGILSEDIQKVLLLGNTMSYPSMVRWLTQKLPDATVETLQPRAIANGLAVAPLYPHLYDVARQQYSDYFLLLEICRLNLTKSISSKQLLDLLQKRGVNIKSCRDRILSILQGDLPDGIFPWQEPEQAIVMEDPTLSPDLFAGRLFELETDGTYQPNVAKFYQLRIYLQAIVSNLSQSLSDPLVFPEIVSKL